MDKDGDRRRKRVIGCRMNGSVSSEPGNSGGAGLGGDGKRFSLGQSSLSYLQAGSEARRATWPAGKERTVVTMETVEEAMGMEMTGEGRKPHPQTGRRYYDHHHRCSTWF